MGQPKPKIKWSCTNGPQLYTKLFKAELQWYGIEIKTEVSVLELDLCKTKDLVWTIIGRMQTAVDEAVARVTHTITDVLDYSEETKAAKINTYSK